MPAELIGLGLATLDHIMVVESFADPVASLKLKAFRVDGGGPVASALVAASRLGVQTEIWTAVGQGPIATQIIGGLERERVGLSGLRVREGEDGPLILVFVNQTTAERRFHAAHWWRSDGPYPLDLDRLDGVRCLLVDGTWPKAAAEAARSARERGVTVVADLGRLDGPYGALVEHVDCLIVDEACAAGLADSDPEQACRLMLQMGPSVAAVTLGERGCVYADSSGVRRQPAFPVEAVDTTGAGDCFHGAFCVGVIRGWDLDATLEFAAAAAALCCTELGGRAGVPGIEGVQQFLRENRR